MAQLDRWAAEGVRELFVIGVTGGIGSGKSTAANYLGALGAAVIDADAIAHRLTAPQGRAIAPIRETFGNEMIDNRGALNRQLMREMAFSDSSSKLQLEAIMHPMIRAEINRELSEIAQAAKELQPANGPPDQAPDYIVLVLPLLFETGAYSGILDRTLVVDCPESRQISRVVQRSALTVDAAKRIMASQVSRAVRLQLADEVLCNSGTTEWLQTMVQTLHTRFCALALKSVGCRVDVS